LDEEEYPRPPRQAVVGVGVTAASISSLETMFAGIEPGSGASYIVAVRQRDGLEVSRVLEVLRRGSQLPVTIGANDERVEPDHIYVGGPDDMIALSDDRLRVRPATEPVGRRATVDTLLVSIAEIAGSGAVAVLLAGLEADGSAGVTATKRCGGLSIAEARAAEDAAAIPGSPGPSGVVDLVLPPDQISLHIAQYLGNLGTSGDAEANDRTPAEMEAQVGQISTILRNVTGHDFHGYKRGTFLRRVHRRLQVLQVDTVGAYVERLRADREEVQNLFQDLLIGVTQFFRDPQEFDLLETEIPRLFEGKRAGDQFRVWVLGCATGEEAYSIAILLREHMALLDHPPHVQIFATDLDARALGLARAGRYTSAIADHVRPDRLERWFVREGDTFCVSKELREMCIFSPHNLVKDAPFSRIDLLSCRNLLIYLNADIQNRVIPIFHFSLQPGGLLFLGSSENVTRHGKLFASIDRRNRLFRRLETATRIIPDFPLTGRARLGEAGELALVQAPAVARLSGMISRQAEAIAERYAPAYVVVDPHYDVLHFSGRTGRFLEPLAGAASLNLINLVHRDLRVELRSALNRAASNGRRVELSRLALRQGDRASAINMVVEPIGGSDITSFVVVFQDAGSLSEGSNFLDRAEGDDHVQRLEADLRLTRERLQATIEELESTNEELKSSNEEYQSINEELQSANEEMETSKEELQSVNEELQTVNGELAHRVAELGRSNSDLKNLLEATQIATVFLDNDLRVRSFTPTATDVFHLLETDIGRPIGHVVSRVTYPELQDDVRRVLKALVPVDRPVVDPVEDRHYAVKVLPYRNVDNYISGAVVTFTDLTAVFRAETALRDSEERFRILVGSWAQATWEAQGDSRVRTDSASWRAYTGQALGEWLEVGWTAAVHPDDRPAAEAQWRQAVAARRLLTGEYRLRRPLGGWSWVTLFAAPLLAEDGSVRKWVGMIVDITESREAQEAVRDSEQRLDSLVKGLPQLIWRAGSPGIWTWCSPQFTAYTGQSEAGSQGWGWLSQVHPRDQEAARSSWSRGKEQGGFDVEYRIRAADGTYRWFQTRAAPVRDEHGETTEWIGTSTDINDLRELQERQGVLVGELQHRTRNLVAVVRQVAERTIRSSCDLPDFRLRFRERLDALARVQGLLSRLKEHDRVTFDELVRTELSAHGVELADARVTVRGPADVRLRSTTVQTLAMALHELSTNAAKYGALVQPNAHLTIVWQLTAVEGEARPWLHIEWRETGLHVPQDHAEQRGQGRELIERGLPYQFSARTAYVLDQDGVYCSITIPVSSTGEVRTG